MKRLQRRQFALTSRLNKTPPTGDPNATDMPEAAAAESTSRLRAEIISLGPVCRIKNNDTLITVDIVKELDEQVRATTSYMDQGSLFTKPQTRRDSKALSSCQ